MHACPGQLHKMVSKNIFNLCFRTLLRFTFIVKDKHGIKTQTTMQKQTFKFQRLSWDISGFQMSKHTGVDQCEAFTGCDAEAGKLTRIHFRASSRQWHKADLGGILKDKASPAQRWRGRSQAEGWVSGVQRVPLVASAEARARSRHGLKGGLSRAAHRGGCFWRVHGRTGSLQAHRGGLWGPREAQLVKIKGVNHSLQHALGALSTL